jgi:hypothetical protein
MPRYGGIDLPSTNRLVAWLDERDHVVADKRLSNDLHVVLADLAPDQADLTGLVVASTDHGYGLSAGVLEAGYRVHLSHPAAITPYEGLTCSNDHVEARFLAPRLRLGMVAAAGPKAVILPGDWCGDELTPHASESGGGRRQPRGRPLGRESARYICRSTASAAWSNVHALMSPTFLAWTDSDSWNILCTAKDKCRWIRLLTTIWPG